VQQIRRRRVNGIRVNQTPKALFQKVDILMSLRRDHTGHWTSRQIAERQIDALEAIATRLANIEIKLERVAAALEREANLSTHPF